MGIIVNTSNNSTSSISLNNHSSFELIQKQINSYNRLFDILTIPTGNNTNNIGIKHRYKNND